MIELKYFWRPKYGYDSVDMVFYDLGVISVLHFFDGKEWQPIPYDKYPDVEEEKKLRKLYPPK